MEMACFVYVMRCEGRTKIGMADDVEKRRRGIQHAVGSPVTLCGKREFLSRKVASAVERSLHSIFAANRLHGEWFTVGAEQAYGALEAMEPPPVTERQVAQARPAAPSRDIIYDAALAMAEGRASRAQIDEAMLLINSR